MRRFTVDPTEFFAVFSGHLNQWPGIEEVMRQFIDRYDIKSRDVLAIGAGMGSEEYWFWKVGGCRLTIVDIDEWGQILPRLIAMRQVPKGLTFHLGDAIDFFKPRTFAGIRLPVRREFDVIYLSGFTPDEQLRHAMMGQQWPANAEPLHPTVVEAARRLRPGGLLIVQSFGYGIDIGYHRNFLPAMQRQLSKISLDLIESFRCVSTTGINLHVAQRRGGVRPSMQTPISRIHGRAEAEPIEQTWSRVPSVAAPLLSRFLRWSLYKSRRWQRVRDLRLAIESRCRECAKRGLVVPAEVADHIESYRGGIEAFFDLANTQSLCKGCHDSHKHSIRSPKLREGCL